MSLAEKDVLHGLLEDAMSDIIVRIDRHGFIETASSNIAELGYDLSQVLLKPHLADLAEQGYAAELKHRIKVVMCDRADDSGPAEWFEFPLLLADRERASKGGLGSNWYALSLRPVTDEAGGVSGAMGLLKSIERQRPVKSDTRTRVMVDPLTGLANRNALCTALQSQLNMGRKGTIAMFAIDQMRAVFMQYGQRTADDIMWSFAKFLETMVGEDHDLAQFDSERFCVILSGLSRKASHAWVDNVLGTFANLALNASPRSLPFSAIAGLAPIADSVDATLQKAEIAVVMARARGGVHAAERDNLRQMAAGLAL